MHVDCFSSPSCGDMVQRATSTVIHVPDDAGLQERWWFFSAISGAPNPSHVAQWTKVWGTFADVIFVLWLFLTILSVLITAGVS